MVRAANSNNNNNNLTLVLRLKNAMQTQRRTCVTTTLCAVKEIGFKRGFKT